jgi:hypothetical protein
VLKVEQEAQVWLCATEHYRAGLTSIVNDAVTSYRRKPGLDSLTRVYKQDVGAAVFGVLESVLPQTNVPRTDSNYIHVRQQLRSHVSYHVLKCLVDDQLAPAELWDALLSIDLGL